MFWKKLKAKKRYDCWVKYKQYILFYIIANCNEQNNMTTKLTPSQKYYTAVNVVLRDINDKGQIWMDQINNNGFPSDSKEYKEHYNNQYKVQLEMMSNPTYLCEVIKDIYIRTVLAIKTNKGLYLYKAFMHPKYNKGLWDYLFDENKVLFWIYRFLQQHNNKNGYAPTLTKYIPFKQINRFSNFIDKAKHFYYQIAPKTQIGKWFKKFKKTNKPPTEIDTHMVMQGSPSGVDIVFQQKKFYTKRMINYRVKGNQRFESHYKTFYKNFWFVKLQDDNGYWNAIGGEHFNYDMDLTKNCLVWDANAEQFRKERIFELWECCFDYYRTSNHYQRTIKNVPRYESDGLVYNVAQYFDFAPEHSFLKKFDLPSWQETKIGYDRRNAKCKNGWSCMRSKYFMKRQKGGKYDWDKSSNPDSDSD